MNARAVARVAVDEALEATVALSFSRLGYDLRRRLAAWDELEERRLDGRVVIVTGATSGLGRAAASTLAAAGASVRLLGRDAQRNDEARAAIVASSGNRDVRADVADLADLASLRAYARRFREEHERLDVLMHNAGALLAERRTSVDGIELTVATHVVGPFALTVELLPLLETTSRSRVITVTSGGMYSQRLDVDHLEMGADDYDGTTAYARAKRAQVVLTRAWADRVPGVVFHAVHPGWADTPGVEQALPAFHRLVGPWLRTPAQGADTMVWLAADDEALLSSGDLWLDRKRRWAHKLPWTALGADEDQRLWDWTATRAGQPALRGAALVPPG